MRHDERNTPAGHNARGPANCDACTFPVAIWHDSSAGDLARLLALMILESRGAAPDEPLPARPVSGVICRLCGERYLPTFDQTERHALHHNAVVGMDAPALVEVVAVLQRERDSLIRATWGRSS